MSVKVTKLRTRSVKVTRHACICARIRTENFILYSDYFEMAIKMGMGKGSKKKPKTKKERAEKRKKKQSRKWRCAATTASSAPIENEVLCCGKTNYERNNEAI